MKLESHCARAFATPVKVFTSGVMKWESVGPRGIADRHWNDKGAWRMKFGMRVRGGFIAVLMMIAVPVTAQLAGIVVATPAAAQVASSIVVEGNRRVEADTIRSYFKTGPNGSLDAGQIDDGLKALIETDGVKGVTSNPAAASSSR